MKTLGILILMLLLITVPTAAADDLLIKIKDPSKFIADTDYNSRIAIFQVIGEQTIAPLAEYQPALRQHFLDHMKERDSETILFAQKNIIILEKYFRDIEQTKKPITDPTDLKMLSGYLSIISAEADKVTGSPIINSIFIFDKSVPVGIKLDPDGKLASLTIPNGDKSAVSLDINGAPAHLKVTKDGIEFYPSGWIDSPGGRMTLKSGSFSLEQLDPKLYGEWNVGVVMKDAASSISLHNSERHPLFIKDSVTPGAGEWMAVMRSVESKATVKPGEATFTKNGYVALRRTDGKDIYLTPSADQGGKIAWGREKAPSDSTLWIKTLSDKNLPYIEGQSGVVTAISRKYTTPFNDYIIRVMQIRPEDYPESSSVTFTRDGPYPRITSDLSNFPEGTTFTGKLDETGTPTNIWTVKKGLGCHQSALNCVQLPSISGISGAPNPKEAALSNAVAVLEAAKSRGVSGAELSQLSKDLRTVADLRRNLPITGMTGAETFQSAMSKSGQSISMGTKMIWDDLRPSAKTAMAQLESNPEFREALNDPARKSAITGMGKTLLEPATDWLKSNLNKVIVKYDRDDTRGRQVDMVGRIDVPVSLDAKIVEHKGYTVGVALKLSPPPGKSWTPQYIYVQNPYPYDPTIGKMLTAYISHLK